MATSAAPLVAESAEDTHFDAGKHEVAMAAVAALEASDKKSSTPRTTTDDDEWVILQRRRRVYILGAAKDGVHVPVSLRATYAAWVDQLLAQRGGVYAQARGDHHGYNAFVFSHTFGLPALPTLSAFYAFGRAAADTLVCLAAGEGLLNLQSDDASSAAAKPAKAILVAWLDAVLVAFDERKSLHDAAFTGDVTRLQQLLSRPQPFGARIHVDEQMPGWPPNGFTCLQVAASMGQTAAVAWLLNCGADIDAASCDGQRALHFAAGGKREVPSAETVSQLLARGADLQAKALDGKTALHSAAYCGRLGATKALLLARADATAKDDSGYTPRDWANTASQDVCCGSPDADWGSVIAILDKVTSMSAEDRHAWVHRSWGLHVASQLQDLVEGGDNTIELLRMLECYGRSIDAKDHDGTTALHSAALCGNGKAVALLLEYGADANVVSNLGEMPLHFAAREGHFAAAMQIAHSGRADLNATTKTGATPLELARRHNKGEWEAVAAIFEKVVNVS